MHHEQFSCVNTGSHMPKGHQHNPRNRFLVRFRFGLGSVYVQFRASVVSKKQNRRLGTPWNSMDLHFCLGCAARAALFCLFGRLPGRILHPGLRHRILHIFGYSYVC